MSDDLLDIADELYGLPLADFTPARDAKAKELKGTDLAAPVKALKKPTMAAWVVNMLVRHETEQVDQVLAVGAALRDAAQSLDGKELARAHQAAASADRGRHHPGSRGGRVARHQGHPGGRRPGRVDPDGGHARPRLCPGAAQRPPGHAPDEHGPRGVRGRCGRRPARGAGLRRVLGTTPVPSNPSARPDLKVVPDPDAEAKKLAAAQAAMEAAEAVEESARATYDEAERAVTELEARSLQVQGEIEERRRQIAELEETAEEVEEELDEAEDARTEARTSLRKAEQAREQAETALDRLRKKR